MNSVVLIGRLVRDADIRYTQADEPMTIARFTLAVDRRYKRDGEQSADFISCIAFGKTADIIEKYVRKGMKIAIDGRIQTGSYTNKEGQKIYTTDIVVNNMEFLEKKESAQEPPTGPVPSEFVPIPDEVDMALPF